MRYRAPRSPASRPIQLVIGQEPRRHSVILLSMSSTGAGISLTEPIAVGERVQMIVQAQRWSARVVWCGTGRAGLAFGRPLTDAELSAIQNEGGLSTRASPRVHARSHHGFRELQ